MNQFTRTLKFGFSLNRLQLVNDERLSSSYDRNPPPKQQELSKVDHDIFIANPGESLGNFLLHYTLVNFLESFETWPGRTFNQVLDPGCCHFAITNESDDVVPYNHRRRVEAIPWRHKIMSRNCLYFITNGYHLAKVAAGDHLVRRRVQGGLRRQVVHR